MDTNRSAVAQACLDGAENNTMTFPQIVGALMQAGFEGYAVDFRRGRASYYLAAGGHVDLPIHRIDSAMGQAFDAGAVQAGIRAAQQLTPGYTYRGFCEQVVAAGCAGYHVSFPGRRAVYYGRTAEVHVELFPN